MIKVILSSIIVLSLFSCSDNKKKYSEAEEKTETVTVSNPVINADVPDMSVIRVGDFYYMISTTMHLMPGAPVMRSRDLVNWETISYVFDRLEDHPRYDLIDGTVYGKGQWASSIKYKDGIFYVLFSPNDEPFKSYIYTAEDPAGKWTLHSRLKHFHDASLFFDDDGRNYVFYGTGELQELNSDLTDIEKEGVNMVLFERDAEEYGLLEGSQVIKHDDKYYLLMISMVWGEPGRVRRQVCYRADNITGPYEKKVILEHDFAGFGGVGQGSVFDGKNGDWWAIIFQDRGGIGRVPMLMPCTWTDGWPMLGDINGHVPEKMEMEVYNIPECKGISGSDDFDKDKLSLFWQWNHNPLNDKWSLTERPGFLRLKTSRVTDNIYNAPNTITQRMHGPVSSATVAIDISGMKDGDVAGFAAFNSNSGILSVKKENDVNKLRMSTNDVAFSEDSRMRVTDVNEIIIEENEIDNDIIYLRIDGDFNQGKDIASFYYSLDNKKWIKTGCDVKMIFDYRRLFMGSKYAIFNYATKASGGYIDIDNFEMNACVSEINKF